MRLTDAMTGGTTSSSTVKRRVGGNLGVKNFAMAIKVLTQYSQPIPSIVRELTSNGFDAHREAKALSTLTVPQLTNDPNDPALPGKGYAHADVPYIQSTFSRWTQKPVRVILQEANPISGVQRAFKVQDFGVGLSEDRFVNVFTVLLESTKRGSNDEHGAFGLGAKSPLSYADLFTVETIWQGEKSTYAVFKTQEGPDYDLISREPTTESNGTTVEVPIASQADFELFKKAIKEQLCYFEGIEYLGITIPDTPVYRMDTFLFREGSPFSEMHLTIDGVVYPINWSALGMQNTYYSRNGHACPVALRFKIGELDIVWNRENVEYNDRTVTAIKNRMAELKKEMQTVWDASFTSIKTMGEYFDASVSQKDSSLEIAPGVKVPNIDDLVERNTTYPKYKGRISIPSELLKGYTIHKHIRSGGPVTYGRYDKKPNIIEVIAAKAPGYGRYFSDGVMTQKRNEFISDCLQREFYIIRRDPDFLTEEARVLDFPGIGRNTLTSDPEKIKVVKEFLAEIDQMVLDRTTSYEDTLPTKEWEDARKQQRIAEGKEKRVREEGEIPVKRLYVDDEGVKWSPGDLKLSDLDDDALFIYGFNEDREALMRIAPVFFSNSRYLAKRGSADPITLNPKACNIVLISKQNMRHFTSRSSKAHIHIGTLLAAKSVFVTRYLTALKMIELMPPGIQRLSEAQFRAISPSVHDAAKFVLGYVKSYAKLKIPAPALASSEMYDGAVAYARQSLSTVDAGMMEVLENHGSWDKDAIERFNEVRLFLNSFPLVQHLDIKKVDANEVRAYLRGKGSENAALLRRLHLRRQTA